MALRLETIGQPLGAVSRSYSPRDAIVHALGVGAGYSELDYLKEEGQKVLPSYAFALTFEFFVRFALASGVNRRANFHGEQEVYFHRSLPVSGTVVTDGAITAMFDKGAEKGALVVAQAETKAEDGTLLCTNVFTLLCPKDGGFNGEMPPQPSAVDYPDRAPDMEFADLPGPAQPLLYRLGCGESFAHHGMHVDPAVAKSNGLNGPLMHGLCTYGYALRALGASLFPNEPERIKYTRVRFAGPLAPGEPIKTLVWKIADGRAVFRTVHAETGALILDRGVVEWTPA